MTSAFKGAYLVTSILLTLWQDWIQIYLTKNSGRIEILHMFTGDRTALLNNEKKATGINWAQGSLSAKGRDLLNGSLNILPEDSPMLFSNFCKAALEDKIDLDTPQFKEFTLAQENGRVMRDHLKTLRGEYDGKKRSAEEAKVVDETSPAPFVKKRKSSLKKIQQKKKVVDSDCSSEEEEIVELTEEQQTEEKQEKLARRKIPEYKNFQRHLSDFIVDTKNPVAARFEAFSSLDKLGYLKEIKFQDQPPDAPAGGPRGMEKWFFQERNFEPQSTFDVLLKKAVTEKEKYNGKKILEAKNEAMAREKFHALRTRVDVMDLSSEDIDKLVPGCVSSMCFHFNFDFLYSHNI